ncbi:MAG: 1-phosphofructokinase, partial [Clostridia bacterium]|nr:1-phosphofructokinase [Clostridia bacterium]
MIYTVTFNPSLDYYLKVNNLKLGAVNRSNAERLTVGGKGINISRQLRNLDDTSVALGFVAGFTGQEIRSEIESLGLKHDLLEVSGRSRINVKIKSTTETDINGTGAFVSADDVKKLAAALKTKLTGGDYVIISGNAPAHLGEEVYADLIYELRADENVNFVVDACGKLLTETLKYKPFLIKPNLFELCEIFGLPTSIDTKIIAEYARKLQKYGARNVIVSMGSEGAVMITETKQSMYVRAARGQLVNSVGAGDCMVAGFVHEYIKTQNYFK